MVYRFDISNGSSFTHFLETNKRIGEKRAAAIAKDWSYISPAHYTISVNRREIKSVSYINGKKMLPFE